jgi:hypothetical protein
VTPLVWVADAGEQHIQAVSGLGHSCAVELGVHRVEVDDLVAVAEGLYGQQPAFKGRSLGHVHDVLDDDGFVVVKLAEPHDIPHRRP